VLVLGIFKNKSLLLSIMIRYFMLSLHELKVFLFHLKARNVFLLGIQNMD